MNDQVCCVCHEPVGAGGKLLGGRCYCHTHYARVIRDRRGLWWASALLVLGLLAFVALVELILRVMPLQLTGAALVAAGVILALVPALIWLAFFYLQDRAEPEPKGYVLALFALGALLAAAVGLPLVRGVFRLSDWLWQSSWVHFAGSILVVGFVQEFLKYAAVRYSVYALPEFDERVDGIIYATAAGLGFATVLNLQYVLESGGVNLQVGVIHMAVVALAQAAFAGITGYFLGRRKFEQVPLWWMPAGLALAALLNGLFTYLRGQVTRTGLDLVSGGGFNPWPGLLLATAVAVAVLVVLNLLIHQISAKDAAAGMGGEL